MYHNLKGSMATYLGNEINVEILDIGRVQKVTYASKQTEVFWILASCVVHSDHAKDC